MLDSCFNIRGGKTFRSGSNTRFGKFSAYFLTQDLCLPQTRLELGSDHCCFSMVIAVKDPRSEVVCSKLKRKYRASKCRRWTVDSEKDCQHRAACQAEFHGTDLSDAVGNLEGRCREGLHTKDVVVFSHPEEPLLCQNSCIRSRGKGQTHQTDYRPHTR